MSVEPRDLPPSGTQSAMRAVSILEQFSETAHTLSVAEISERTGLTASTAYRLTRALASRDLLAADSVGSHYRLGPSILRLARSLLNTDISLKIRPVLQEIQEATGETVSLFIRAGDQRTCLVELPSAHPIRMISGTGQSYPLGSGAAGKAICSLLSAADRGDSASSGSVHDLLEPSTVRESGIAESVGETVEGASAIAVAFFGSVDSSRREAYAVNVTGPVGRFNRDSRAACAPLLLDLVDRFSNTLSQH